MNVDFDLKFRFSSKYFVVCTPNPGWEKLNPTRWMESVSDEQLSHETSACVAYYLSSILPWLVAQRGAVSKERHIETDLFHVCLCLYGRNINESDHLCCF